MSFVKITYLGVFVLVTNKIVKLFVFVQCVMGLSWMYVYLFIILFKISLWRLRVCVDICLERGFIVVFY